MLELPAAARQPGAALGLGWALAAFACAPAPTEPCGGRCGPGTACVDGNCQAVAGVEPTPEAAPRRGRKGKRGRKAAAVGVAGDGAEVEADAPGEDPALPPFVAVDDRKIPEFSAGEPQTLDMQAGSERLSEAVLDQHFSRVNPEIQGCVATASRYGEVGAGTLKFKLRLLPSGKVESVSVAVSDSLRVWGIPPCTRAAVFAHRFPAFDGPAMAVSFSVDID